LREVETDIYNGLNLNQQYNLIEWAKQGVLLLNTALTVEEHKPGSHIKIWKPFTEYVFKILENEKSNIVYMLWGNESKKYKNLINCNNNYILESGHPSPLSANKGLWFNNKHFSKCNDYLIKQNKYKINW
jgi:uracil-DNA glycosylase